MIAALQTNVALSIGVVCVASVGWSNDGADEETKTEMDVQ
jgi:hypothetical protein